MPPQVRDRIIDAFTEFANDFIEIHILHPVFLTTAPPQHKIQLASRLVPRALLFPSRTPRASKMPVQNLSAEMQTIGNYDLLEKIAEGGMGTVYKGKNRATGEMVAIKVVPSHLLTNPVVVKRFEQEYNVARQIDHPNIVKALDFGAEGDTRYLVMEYVEGESLGQKIERDGCMQEQVAIGLIMQIAEALHTAHKQGLIHRDVKPDNILVTVAGIAKLTDLGLVKEVEADLNLTRTGRGLGTPHFMAPEQFRNAKKADARCDIYSLGATLYMMVTGELPFQSNGPLDAWMKKINNEIESPRKRAPNISERIDWAIRRAISPDPVHRPENCREFIEDLIGHTTRDLSNADTNLDGRSEYWYMVYTDEESTVHTVKGTVKGIRRSLRDGLLGDAENVRVARQKIGPFESLRAFAEFRDLVIQPAKMPQPSGTIVKPNSKLMEKSIHASTPSMPTPGATAVKAGDSTILATTTIGMAAVQAAAAAAASAAKAKAAAPSGPRINLIPAEANWSPEFAKWMAMAFFFGSIGITAAFFMPTILRYIRFM
jgi:serine/threonine protein kinase